MAFKMKGSPMHKGTTSHTSAVKKHEAAVKMASALKHDEAQLKRSKSQNADFKHDPKTHTHEGNQIWDTEKTTTGEDGSTRTTQKGVEQGTSGETKCTTKGYKWNPDTKKCEKTTPSVRSEEGKLGACDKYKQGDNKGTDSQACKDYKKSKEDREKGTTTTSTDDKPLERESSTPGEKKTKKECEKIDCGEKQVWNQEKCKCEKRPFDRALDCVEKKCKGILWKWSATACRCVKKSLPQIPKIDLDINKSKTPGSRLRKAGEAIGRIFKRNPNKCPNPGWFSSKTGECKKPSKTDNTGDVNYS